MDNRGITASDRGSSMSTSAEPPAAAEMAPAENLGGRLRQARLQANLSLREVARQLGVSASFVSQLENGKSQPSVATLYSLARLLGVSIDRLFDEQERAARGGGHRIRLDDPPSLPEPRHDARPRDLGHAPQTPVGAAAGHHGRRRPP